MLVLFCCSAVSATVSEAANSVAVIANKVSAPSSESSEPAAKPRPSATKPDAPAPKFNFNAGDDAESTSLAFEPGAAAEPLKSPVKPATSLSYETPRKRKIWYGLMAANHGAAAFDAWTTRRAISGGYGTEGDPLQRPFANSGAIYATTQIVPTVMDFLGHRMMHSENPTLRKFWWVPQAASASVSFGAGVHNYRVVH